ncbi:hypothetical protein QBC43DRAFT_315916 [Cladorrhinum sp. PSN259]|nr:hypothetical protein QBC43DRAFT_315916 [Cladorrhinum sp. PSN259]
MSPSPSSSPLTKTSTHQQPQAQSRITPQSTLLTLLGILTILIALFPSLFRYLLTSHSAAPPTMWTQKHITLPPKSRGSYLITDLIVQQLQPELRQYKVGLLNLFVQHTSCALSLNENWDEDVRADMSDTLDRIVPEAGPNGEELYRHSCEGPDDLPAHVKSALIGASVTIPIKDGKLCTGTWQGIWYLEFRAQKHTRKVVATIQGEKAQ